MSRFERGPVTEPKEWWHRMPVKRRNTYRRLALEHVGATNLISEYTITRSHDRSLPLLLKMFASINYSKRSFNATEQKVNLSKSASIFKFRLNTGQEWDNSGLYFNLTNKMNIER